MYILSGFSIKYTILDPVKVTKNGFWAAIFETLDNKVIDLLCSINYNNF